MALVKIVYIYIWNKNEYTITKQGEFYVKMPQQATRINIFGNSEK